MRLPEPIRISPSKNNIPSYLQLLNVDTKDLHLPTQWNPKDKCIHIELSHQNLRLVYTGAGKNDADAASVRSNYPMPPQIGIFYYEVEIVSKGRDGYIGVGFCSQTVSLQRLPGWEPQSWGYHGDDGYSFCSSGHGKPFGPTYTTGDTVGCLLNFYKNEALFTKNGVVIGKPFKDLKLNTQPIFASVGLRTPGELLETNFGQKPFLFDIQRFIIEEKRQFLQMIHQMPMEVPSLSSLNLKKVPKEGYLIQLYLNHQLLEYFLYYGHVETAKQFAKSIGLLQPQQQLNKFYTNFEQTLKEAEQRKELIHLILEGKMTEAKEKIEKNWPIILEKKSLILFELECRQFIEKMLDATQQHESMEIYPTEVKKGKQKQKEEIEEMEEEEEMSQALKDALLFGQKLQNDFRDDARPEVQTGLIETFSLLAYTDPLQSPVRHLLSIKNRIPLAYKVNEAIMKRNGNHQPVLKRVCQYFMSVVEGLKHEKQSVVAFLDMKGFFQSE